MRNASRCLLLIALLIIVSGCSSNRFFYNRLDFFLPWYLGDYVSLQREQEALLEAELEPFLAWHRNRELPRYHALLGDLRSRLARDLTPADIDYVTLEAQAALDRLQWRALEWMLTLGESLSDDQVAEFIQALREQHSEHEEKYLERDAQEYRDDACERLDDNVRRFLGRLQAEQKARLHAACDTLRRSDHLWLANRARWIDELEGILRREPGWQQRLRGALATREETMPEEYRDAWRYNTLVLQAAVLAVVNRRSERQDRHLMREIDKLQRDLVQLSDALPIDP